MIKIAPISVVKAIAKVIDGFNAWFHYFSLGSIDWSNGCHRRALGGFRNDGEVLARVLKVRLVIVECRYGLCDDLFLTNHFG